MRTLLFELCAETLEAARAAETGGADRVELCSDLGCGGVTPGQHLMAGEFRSFAIPVFVLIRPRGGTFNFSADEFELMRGQIEQAKQAGASGVALGVLLPDGRVDVERTRALVELARPLAVTFHRAFDETPDLSEALECVIETGADNLLTSGGAADVLTGAESIARLQRQAGERIHIIAGGGLRLANLAELVRRSETFSVHGSLIRGNGNGTNGADKALLEAHVREAVRLLRNEFRSSEPALLAARSGAAAS
jgi:copper homeostasis protein